MKINFDQLAIVPYLDMSKISENMDRSIALQSYYNGEWHMPMPIDDKIILMKGIPAESTYLSKSIVDNSIDVYIFAIDYLYQYAAWNDIVPHIHALINYYITMFTCVSKMDLYVSTDVGNLQKANYMKTELEYLYITCKSCFDTLQKIISKLWNTKIQLLGTIEKRNLPDTFRKVIISDKVVKTLDRICSDYNIPEQLARFYINQVDFYEKLKNIRDDIVHHDKSLDYFFVFEKGFAISKENRLFSKYEIWNEKDKEKNDLYSVRPLIHYIIQNTVKACNDYCDCIRMIIKFPDSIFKDYHFFLRTPALKSFLSMDRELKEKSWW